MSFGELKFVCSHNANSTLFIRVINNLSYVRSIVRDCHRRPLIIYILIEIWEGTNSSLLKFWVAAKVKVKILQWPLKLGGGGHVSIQYTWQSFDCRHRCPIRTCEYKKYEYIRSCTRIIVHSLCARVSLRAGVGRAAEV